MRENPTTSFYRASTFSRIFIASSAVALIVLAILARVIFRVIGYQRRRRGNDWIRILVVGANEFAHRAANRLMAGQVTPCKVVGFLRLPGRESAISRCPVYEAEGIGKLTADNAINEVILALPLSCYAEIPKLMSLLDPLCVPVRKISSAGPFVRLHSLLANFRS